MLFSQIPIADLPLEIRGEFGPGVKSLAMIQKHVCNMSEPKIEAFFQNVGIKISQSTISRILTKGDDVEIFHRAHSHKVGFLERNIENDLFRQIQEQRWALALRCSWIAEINHFSMIFNECPTFLECAQFSSGKS
jgi:hypothetical protein